MSLVATAGYRAAAPSTTLDDRQTPPDLFATLIPAVRTDQAWWAELVEPYRDRPGSPLRVEFIPGRPRFAAPGQTLATVGSPPFGCCLLIWQPHTFHPDRFTVGLFARGDLTP